MANAKNFVLLYSLFALFYFELEGNFQVHVQAPGCL